MKEQRVFQFDYHRRGQTHIWDKGKGHFVPVNPSDRWKDEEVRVEEIGEFLVRISVFDPAGVNAQEHTFDCNNAAFTADEEFRQRFPGRYLAELE